MVPACPPRQARQRAGLAGHPQRSRGDAAVTRLPDEDRVVPARARVVRAASGARALRRVPVEEEPLALVAPAPVMLPVGCGRLVDQLVGAAGGLVVRPADGAAAVGRVVAEEHALALLAPAPARLAGGNPHARDGNDHVVVAARRPVVRAARRAGALGRVASEEYALALLAPAPVALSEREVGHDPGEHRADAGRPWAHAELDERAPDALPKRRVLVRRDAPAAEHLVEREQDCVARLRHARVRWRVAGVEIWESEEDGRNRFDHNIKPNLP